MGVSHGRDADVTRAVRQAMAALGTLEQRVHEAGGAAYVRRSSGTGRPVGEVDESNARLRRENELAHTARIAAQVKRHEPKGIESKEKEMKDYVEKMKAEHRQSISNSRFRTRLGRAKTVDRDLLREAANQNAANAAAKILSRAPVASERIKGSSSGRPSAETITS